MAGEDLEQVERDLDVVLRGALPGVVTKWVVVAEVVDEDRALLTFAGPIDGIKAWDTKGMLSHASDLMLAQTLDGEDEDEEGP